MIITIVMRDYSVKDPYSRMRYIGAPCLTFEEAREVVYGHHHWGCDFHTSYVDNGTDYIEINGETGELVAEYFVRVATKD